MKTQLLLVSIFLLMVCLAGCVAEYGIKNNGPVKIYQGVPSLWDYYGLLTPIKNYPGCLGSDPNLWDNCYGNKTWGLGDGRLKTETSLYVKGKSHALVYYAEYDLVNFDNDKFHCEFYRVNGIKHGWETCYLGKNFNPVSKKYFSNGIHSPKLEQEITNNLYKNECQSLGFQVKTPEIGNCILRLRELNKTNQPTQVVQPMPSRTKPTTADQLEGWTQILQGLEGVVGEVPTKKRRTSPDVDVICPKISEYTSGLYKICVYKCVGGQTTQTARRGDMCPASASF
jgi:hypothetical protein